MMLLDNIRHLCKSRGLKLSEVEKKAGLAGKTIFRWDKTSPSIEKVAAVADVIGVSVDELLGREAGNFLTAKEWDLVQGFRGMNSYGQAALLEQLQVMAEMPMYKKNVLPIFRRR